MKKVVLKLDLHDDRYKQKAMQRVSGFPGVSSISMEMKDQKLTVIGDIDPVSVVAKLRKICHTEIVSVGEPDKKKAEPKKEEPKKDDKKDDLAEYWKAYQAHLHQPAPYYYVKTVEDPDPYGCVVM